MGERAIRSRAWLAVAIVVLLLLVDQGSKIWIKTHYFLGESTTVFSWFQIRFIQNPGMAFGLELGSKMFLTLFRVVMVGAGIWYLSRMLRRPFFPTGYVATIALIVAGAAGNIFDCLFYGLIFDNPPPPWVATWMPWGDGYASFGHGMVVDMLYFPLFSFLWPEWMPMVGGNEFSFFDPVFNVADSAITVGFCLLVLFYSRYIGSFMEVYQRICPSRPSDSESA